MNENESLDRAYQRLRTALHEAVALNRERTSTQAASDEEKQKACEQLASRLGSAAAEVGNAAIELAELRLSQHSASEAAGAILLAKPIVESVEQHARRLRQAAAIFAKRNRTTTSKGNVCRKS